MNALKTPAEILVADVLKNHGRYKWAHTTPGIICTFFWPAVIDDSMRPLAALNVYFDITREPEAIHSHTFDFKSLLVCGAMKHVRYEETDDAKGEWRYQTGNFTRHRRNMKGEVLSTEICGLSVRMTEEFMPGDSYSILSTEIHSVEPRNGTVTFVTPFSLTSPIDFCSYRPIGGVPPEPFVREQASTETVERAVAAVVEKWTL